MLYHKHKNRSTYSVLSKIIFFVFICLIIFGTDIPFRKIEVSADEHNAPNPIKQVILSVSFIISISCLYNKKKALISLIKNEKILCIFLFWCLLSTTWSDHSLESAKRIFQIIAAAAIVLSVLLNVEKTDEILKILCPAFLIYSILTILSIIFVPEAAGFNRGWQGMAEHKNTLGQISFVSTLYWAFLFKADTNIIRRAAYLMMCLATIILLLGSKSATSLIAFIVVSICWLVYSLDNHLEKNRVGRPVSILLCLSLLSFSIFALFYLRNIIITIPGLVGKDITFTGRTDLWAYMLREFNGHKLFGCGFGGFWVLGDEKIKILHEIFIYEPMQAHMGYIDILNETGLIGFTLFFIMITRYLIVSIRFGNYSIWLLVIIGSLAINSMETVLFRPNSLLGIFFFFAYFNLYHSIDNKWQRDYKPIYRPFSLSQSQCAFAKKVHSVPEKI